MADLMTVANVLPANATAAGESKDALSDVDAEQFAELLAQQLLPADVSSAAHGIEVAGAAPESGQAAQAEVELSSAEVQLDVSANPILLIVTAQLDASSPQHPTTRNQAGVSAAQRADSQDMLRTADLVPATGSTEASGRVTVDAQLKSSTATANEADGSALQPLPAEMTAVAQAPEPRPIASELSAIPELKRDAITSPTSVEVRTSMSAPAWSDAFGDRVLWLIRRGEQSAQLHVNPPELGPVSISLSIQDDQVSALFVSEHILVRETIEAALPKLRELIQEQGLKLGNASVGSEMPRQQRHAPALHSATEPEYSTSGATIEHAPRIVRGRGVIDIFA